MNYKHALSSPIFEIISKSTEELGFDSYVIGGFVRDFILDHCSKKDIDIVATGSGIELAKHVSKKLPNNPKVQIFTSTDKLERVYTQRWLDAIRQPWEAYACSRKERRCVQGAQKVHQSSSGRARLQHQ